jgi:acetoin utilization deacetylase AcuC-like enzyme
VKAFYSDIFVLPLPASHRFPMDKYRLLREKIAHNLPSVELIQPQAATDGVLALAHHPHYVQALTTGTLPPAAQKEIGFPWSPEMVERSRRSAGATIGAARAALIEGVSVNLAGGTHHAGTSTGGGFCCFNDFAVAARLMQAERRIQTAAIIDLDVHQGNGTAEILKHDSSIFTLSMHGEKNYPFKKEQSDLDVPLPDGTDDVAYLAALAIALKQLRARCAPDLIFYLAGADVFSDDRLGKLALTKKGIAARDQTVFEFASSAFAKPIPVVVAMGGGYCAIISDIVDLHFATVLAALRYFETFHEN